MKIVFDLDGVLRNTMRYLNERYGVPKPTSWEWLYKDKDIFHYAKLNNYAMVREAKPTKLVAVLNKYIECPEIWTHQPWEWMHHTKEWLGEHIGNCTVKILKPEEKREELDGAKDTILVDDYPAFKNYRRVALVRHLYNSHVKGMYNIKTVGDFEKLLIEVGGCKERKAHEEHRVV